MFDISWSEFLLIGVVALIVIGPKELPAVMRTLGQWTRKVRVMAADFQNQFQEAMREAEMADLKKQVDDMAQDVKSFDPLASVHDDIAGVGNDVERSIAATPSTSEEAPALPESAAEAALIASPAEPLPAVPQPVSAPPAAEPAALAEAPRDGAEAAAPARAPDAAAAADTVDKAAPAEAAGRSG
jgi:sec-independent protein translocase protein TatB